MYSEVRNISFFQLTKELHKPSCLSVQAELSYGSLISSIPIMKYSKYLVSLEVRGYMCCLSGKQSDFPAS